MEITSGSVWGVGTVRGIFGYDNPYDHPYRNRDGDFYVEEFRQDGKIIESNKHWSFSALQRKLIGRTISSVEIISEEDDSLLIILDDGTKISTWDDENGGYCVYVNGVDAQEPEWVKNESLS